MDLFESSKIISYEDFELTIIDNGIGINTMQIENPNAFYLLQSKKEFCTKS